MNPPKAWNHTGTPHLYRHQNGTFYARLNVDGKPTFRSLKTKILSVAKPLLNEKLQDNEHRKEQDRSSIITEKMTGADAMALRESQLQNDPSTKQSTKRYWRDIFDILKKTWPEFPSLEIRKVSVEQCEKWAGQAVKTVSPTRFNNTRLLLKSLFQMAIKGGVRRSNPVLEVKRAKIRRKDLSGKLPGKSHFKKWVDTLRSARGKTSQDRADFVEWLAYTGMRLEESKLVLWKHCDFGREEILVVGDAKDGTKNGSFRRIPMIADAKTLLQKIKGKRQKVSPDEPIVRVKTAYAAMGRAAKKIGMEPLSHHDLRHLFATICIESGVDIPTVSRRLGHRDGGVLAMKVYGHLRNEHSRLASSRVSFSS